MRILETVVEAETLRVNLIVALAKADAARAEYIAALKRLATDVELRRIHLEAMSAAMAADKAAGALLGIRTVEYAE